MSNRTLRQFLQSLSSAGVTHLPFVELPKPVARPMIAIKRPALQSAVSAAQSSSPLKAPSDLARDSVQPPPALPETVALCKESLAGVDDKADALSRLRTLVAACRRCQELADTRTQTVFGVGHPDARIMFIGEAPGADEDRAGEPFVGAAGQLLNKIVSACGLKREDIYICNILRCRPPGNRNPLPQEAANCREFLDGQIRIVNPEYIVCWGTVAAQNLLGEDRTVGKLRGQFLSYGSAKVLCTYHPSYLLRQPAAKKQVWDDMKFFMKDMGVDLDGHSSKSP
ncbi:MAG: uracil-DNA glycosylase [Planctomycetaceae bacterium]